MNMIEMVAIAHFY